MIAKTKHLKEYGVDKFLKPFVSDVNKLSSPNGCVFGAPIITVFRNRFLYGFMFVYIYLYHNAWAFPLMW